MCVYANFLLFRSLRNLMNNTNNSLTTISLRRNTKNELNKLKLCSDETYESLLKRVLINLGVQNATN